jgi:hypothetical protein
LTGKLTISQISTRPHDVATSKKHLERVRVNGQVTGDQNVRQKEKENRRRDDWLAIGQIEILEAVVLMLIILMKPTQVKVIASQARWPKIAFKSRKK